MGNYGPFQTERVAHTRLLESRLNCTRLAPFWCLYIHIAILIELQYCTLLLNIPPAPGEGTQATGITRLCRRRYWYPYVQGVQLQTPQASLVKPSLTATLYMLLHRKANPLHYDVRIMILPRCLDFLAPKPRGGQYWIGRNNSAPYYAFEHCPKFSLLCLWPWCPTLKS